MSGRTYRVGARGSPLSLAQAGEVAAMVEGADPGSTCEAVAIRTSGDASQGSAEPLFATERRGVFEREIDEAVAGGRVDFAVHSLKDVPAGIPGGLAIACVPPRAAPNDALVARRGSGGGLGSVPRGGTVGTSSLRRAAQVRRLRPDLAVRPVRGNVGTRLRKMRGGECDALVLAQAGLDRLGVAEYEPLPLGEFVPSPGQGALAVVARMDDRPVVRMLAGLEHRPSRCGADAERALSAAVGSGCRFPVGAHAEAGAGGSLSITAAALSADGRTEVRAVREGPASRCAELGRLAGEDLRRGGADALAAGWRELVREWNRR